MRLIDLDEFLRQNCVDRMDGKSCDECKHHVLEVSCERLMEQPTAEVTLCHLDSPCEYQNADIAMPTAEKIGKWIEISSGGHWKCSRCNCRAGFWFNEENSCEWSMDMSEWLSDFCPNCGARMKGDGEDDER